jgi:hypothetical protein
MNLRQQIAYGKVVDIRRALEDELYFDMAHYLLSDRELEESRSILAEFDAYTEKTLTRMGRFLKWPERNID